MKQYTYKRQRRKPLQPPSQAFKEHREGEFLTGKVLGFPASDLEERFARALYRLNIPFLFRYRIPAWEGAPIMNLLGEVEIDFLIILPVLRPVQIDGEYAHKGAEKREEDAKKDGIVNEYFSDKGALPVVRIPHYMLKSQEDANRLVTREFVL